MSASSTDGTLFPPKYIENKLKFYPNIREAVAYGDGRDLVTVMLNIDLDRGRQLGRAQQRGLWLLSGTGRPPASLRHDRKARRRGEPLAGRRASVMAGAQIKRFLILHKELDADDGELTRTAEGAARLRRRTLRAADHGAL